MVKSKESGTGNMARRLEARIGELDRMIGEIDERAERARSERVESYIRASSYPGMKSDQEARVRRWAATEGDGAWAQVIFDSDRGALVSERHRLRNQLNMLAGGRQLRWRM